MSNLLHFGRKIFHFLHFEFSLKILPLDRWGKKVSLNNPMERNQTTSEGSEVVWQFPDDGKFLKKPQKVEEIFEKISAYYSLRDFYFLFTHYKRNLQNFQMVRKYTDLSFTSKLRKLKKSINIIFTFN